MLNLNSFKECFFLSVVSLNPRIGISAEAEAMIASSHNLDYLGRKILDNNKEEVIN